MITSLANEKVKLVRALSSRRRVRYRERQLVAEGTRLVRDAWQSGHRPVFVFYTPSCQESKAAQSLLDDLSADQVSLFLVSEEVMTFCADTGSPQGILAVFFFPTLAQPDVPSFVLLLDKMRDPGNLGTILRTAAASGVDLVLLPPGNVDPTNPKVMRGGMGAHFRLPIRQLGWDDAAATVKGLDTWIAVVDGGEPYSSVNWSRPIALIVGGEAHGAGNRAAQLATHKVCIPMPGGTESLNAAVATGVLLFEVVRQRSTDQIQDVDA